MRKVPFVKIDHAVASVDFDDRSDQRNGAVANFLDVRALIDGEAIGQLHERGGRAGLGRVNRAGDVVDGHRFGDELVGFRVIELDRAGITELAQPGAVFLQIFQIFFRRNRDGDHLAAFFGLANGKDFHTRTGFLKQTHVAVDIFGVGKDSRRAGHIAKHRLRRRDVFGRRQIVHERRAEVRLGGVLADFLGVGLVHGLLRVAPRRRFSVCPGARRDRAAQRDEQNKLGPAPTPHDASPVCHFERIEILTHLEARKNTLRGAQANQAEGRRCRPAKALPGSPLSA